MSQCSPSLLSYLRIPYPTSGELHCVSSDVSGRCGTHEINRDGELSSAHPHGPASRGIHFARLFHTTCAELPRTLHLFHPASCGIHFARLLAVYDSSTRTSGPLPAPAEAATLALSLLRLPRDALPTRDAHAPCVPTPALSCDPARRLDVSAHHSDTQGPHLSAGLPRAPCAPSAPHPRWLYPSP